MRVLTLTNPRMKGPDVTAVQKALRIPADGTFGTPTAQAILAWKRRVGYPENEINAGIGIRGQGYLLGKTPFPADYLLRSALRGLQHHSHELIRDSPAFGVGTAPTRQLRWPVKPFDGPHGVRGTFGEVRGLIGVAGARGLTGPRLHQFLDGLNPVLPAGRRIIHHGIDIIAPDLTPVYALTDGVAQWGGADNYSRFVRVGDFEYVHLKDPIREGARVKAFSTVIGKVFPGQQHVHFTRWAGGRPVNPLGFGGMMGYVDTAPPEIHDLIAYRNDGSRGRSADDQRGCRAVRQRDRRPKQGRQPHRCLQARLRRQGRERRDGRRPVQVRSNGRRPSRGHRQRPLLDPEHTTQVHADLLDPPHGQEPLRRRAAPHGAPSRRPVHG